MDLCSQHTMSRLEDLPTASVLKRMMAAMVELFCDSFPEIPRRIVLDVDDTEDRVHGWQELALSTLTTTALLPADPRLRGHDRQTGRGHPALRQDPGWGRGRAQFHTIPLALIKVAGRVTEMATRIKLALPSSYPYRSSLVLLASLAARPR